MKKPCTTHIWTDGSYSPLQHNNKINASGYGFIIDVYWSPHKMVGSGSADMGKYGGSACMELTAVLLALLSIKPVHRKGHVQLYTDYQALVNAVNEPENAVNWYTHPILGQPYRAIREVLETYDNIEFFWTRGHSGKRGNSLADKLAYSAMQDMIQSSSVIHERHMYEYEQESSHYDLGCKQLNIIEPKESYIETLLENFDFPSNGSQHRIKVELEALNKTIQEEGFRCILQREEKKNADAK